MVQRVQFRSKTYADGLAGDITPAPCTPDVSQGAADAIWEASGQVCDRCNRPAYMVTKHGLTYLVLCERCLDKT